MGGLHQPCFWGTGRDGRANPEREPVERLSGTVTVSCVCLAAGRTQAARLLGKRDV